MSVFVDGAAAPALTVDRLRPGASGKVGAWVDSAEGAFARLKTTPK